MPSLTYVVPCPEQPLARDMAGGQGFGSSDEQALPPLDGLYLATTAKQQGFDVQVFDLHQASHRQRYEAEAESCDYLVVELSLPTLDQDVDAALEIQQRCGGALYFRTYVEERELLKRALARSGAEAILRSQNYKALLEVLTANSNAGSCWLEDGELREEPALPVHNADELPVPDRSLLGADAIYRYPLLPDGPVTTVKSSWGCPFSCGYYCPYPLAEGRAAVLRSAAHVVSELQQIVDLGIQRVLFRDATFTLDKQRTRDMCQGILDAGLQIEWWCETRIDLVDHDLLELMHRAGCRGLNVGVETGDPELMSRSLKTGLDQQKLRNFIADAKGVGLEFHLLCVLGLPGETRQTIANTFRFLNELRPESLNFTNATPYPGTNYHRDASEYGWMLPGEFDRFAANNLVARSIFLDADELQWANERIWRFIGAYRAAEESTVKEVLTEVEAWAQESSWPYVTVVVPTFNRADKLKRCLDRLARQSLPTHTFEVVVVNDGSTDTTQDVLESYVIDAPYELRFFHQENSGPATGRNLAIEKARGEVVLFIGDDIYLAPDAVQHHAAWHKHHDAIEDAMVGHVDWAPSVPVSPFMRWLDTTNLQFGFHSARHGEQQGYGFFYTANLSLKRELLQRHGVFDQAFRHAIWEDIELGYRLELRGLRIWYNSSAKAQHDEIVTLERFRERQRLVGRYTMLVLARHPDYVGHDPGLVGRILQYSTIALQPPPGEDADETTRFEHDIASGFVAGLQDGFAEYRDQLNCQPADLASFLSTLPTQALSARAQNGHNNGAPLEDAFAELRNQLVTANEDLQQHQAVEAALRRRIEALTTALRSADQAQQQSSTPRTARASTNKGE